MIYFLINEGIHIVNLRKPKKNVTILLFLFYIQYEFM